jgi:hypothetical protein
VARGVRLGFGKRGDRHRPLTLDPRVLAIPKQVPAVVQGNDFEAIVNADRIFDAIGSLKRLDPLALNPEEH